MQFPESPMQQTRDKPILVTGVAGFIGFHLADKLLAGGHHVIGIDNFNDYYDVDLKKARVAQIKKYKNFEFHPLDITDRSRLQSLFKHYTFDYIFHLAAQAGVRFSLENPHAYVESNLAGFMNVLEECRYNKVKHFIFASTSAVYGANSTMPFSIHHNVDHPISFYAATKRANELMAHSHAYNYGLPCTGLRFFTVYGPWGRPDMAMFIFTRAILQDETIEVNNYGEMLRDFTYIDDVVEGILQVANSVPEQNSKWTGENPDPSVSCAPFKIYNIGNHSPVNIIDLITLLETELKKKARKVMMPIQPGEVPATYADIQDIYEDVGFAPSTPIEVGVKNFVKWYRQFYEV